MAKIIPVVVKNGNTLSTINNNFSAIAAELQDKVLYRNNPVGEPNTIQNTLDLNGNDIINGGTINAEDVLVDGLTIDAIVDAALSPAVDAAEASATAAAASAVTAAGHALNAGTSESVAVASAASANASAIAAAASAASIAGGPVASYNGRTGAVVSDPADKVGLLLVKGDVGLGNVDNTSDLAKPVSTAVQTQLDLKAALASPALTGVPTAPTAAVGTDTTQLATTAYVIAESRGVKFKATRATSQAIVTGTPTAIIFDVEATDSHAAYNPANGHFVAPVSGFYQFNWNVICNSTTAFSNVHADLFVNGVELVRGSQIVIPEAAGLQFYNSNGSIGIEVVAGADFAVVLSAVSAAGTITVIASVGSNFSGFLVQRT